MSQRKIYYSFHDIPGTQPYDFQRSSEFTGLKFSRTEIVQILIAMGVLTIAFSFALAPYPPLSHLSAVLNVIPLAFIAIITAFMFHEIAHKLDTITIFYWLHI